MTIAEPQHVLVSGGPTGSSYKPQVDASILIEETVDTVCADVLGQIDAP